jgi:cytochrome P450
MTAEQTFDQHSPEHAEDPVGAYRAIRQDKGVVHSTAHGGFTAFTRYEDVGRAAAKPDWFSSAFELPGGEGYGGGITLPRNPANGRTSLAEMDGAEWRRYRRMLNPYFTPEAVDSLTPQLYETTNASIDRFIASGKSELMADLCSPVPAIVTLAYLGLDTTEWERYAVPLHVSTYTPRAPGHPDFQKLRAGFDWIFQQIRDEIARRRREPRPGDLLQAIMDLEDDEGSLTDELVFETAYTLVAAGAETTASLLSSALWHFDQHPEDRQRVMDDPSLLGPACEEFLRYYTPEQAGARTITQHVEHAGATLERGDRVLLAWASANRDDSQFPEPDEFVLDRKPNRHMAFGFGIHRCLGSHLARKEFDVVMREVFRRIPDYKIDRERTHTYPDVGMMFGFQEMPATFTPGEPEGR